jgi:hypothetical protein
MKKKVVKESKTLSRSPQESVNQAKKNMNTDVVYTVNKEIKDIVDDILNGKLQKAMNSDVAKKVGIKESTDEQLEEISVF